MHAEVPPLCVSSLMSIAPSVFPLEREPIDTYTRRVTDATDLVIYRRWRVCTEEMKSDEVR